LFTQEDLNDLTPAKNQKLELNMENLRVVVSDIVDEDKEKGFFLAEMPFIGFEHAFKSTLKDYVEDIIAGLK